MKTINASFYIKYSNTPAVLGAHRGAKKPDHLGSSSFVSDNLGYPSQHLEYFPFGETFVDENIGSYNTPYKFNAKELDEESGLYYYGARYYSGRESIWLGVDPQADKYPSWSTYNYCLNNPIRYVDPDGKGPGDVLKGFSAAMFDYSTLGLTNLRGQIPVKSSEAADFNKGLQMADAFVMALALSEIGGGTGISGAGLVTIEAGVTSLIIPGVGEVTFGVAGTSGSIMALAGIVIAAKGEYLLKMSKENNSEKNGYRTPEYKTAKSNVSGKDGAKDKPDWASGNKPFKDENGKQFAKRLMDQKYGEGKYKTGSGSEFSKIQKWGDRSFE